MCLYITYITIPDKKGNVVMGKAFRKPVPSPPHWYWADTDNCYGCKNKNNCTGCSFLKANRSEQMERQKRREKKELRKYVYGEE